jgi:hypothetical protein
MLNVAGEYTFREMADMHIMFGRTYGDEHAAVFGRTYGDEHAAVFGRTCGDEHAAVFFFFIFPSSPNFIQKNSIIHPYVRISGIFASAKARKRTT